jgi:hypothetical protein
LGIAIDAILLGDAGRSRKSIAKTDASEGNGSSEQEIVANSGSGLGGAKHDFDFLSSLMSLG